MHGQGLGAWVAVVLLCVSGHAFAEEPIPISLIGPQGMGRQIGGIAVKETRYGVVFTPTLQGLPPGLHGFHLHENASCGADEIDGHQMVGGKAGGHYDPTIQRVHGTPWGDGHLGDLPMLYVDPQGQATQPVLAPRLRISDLPNHALMIDAGLDNYADSPAADGGSGVHIACGVMH